MSEVKQYQIIPHIVTAVEFPDNGPEQGDVSRWVKENGGEMKLYDGNIQNNVETSTDAVWRWSQATVLPSTSKYASVGDYIVKLPSGFFEVYKPDIFASLFKPATQQKKEGKCK